MHSRYSTFVYGRVGIQQRVLGRFRVVGAFLVLGGLFFHCDHSGELVELLRGSFRSHVILEDIERRIKILCHFDLAFVDVPRDFLPSYRRAGQERYRSSTLRDNDVLAGRSSLNESRQAVLCVRHVYHGCHAVLRLAYNSDLHRNSNHPGEAFLFRRRDHQARHLSDRFLGHHALTLPVALDANLHGHIKI